MQVKLKKYYLIFLVLYLIALILLGANRLGPCPLSGVPPKTVLSKAWVYIWSLMSSQTIGWWANSLVVLVILVVARARARACARRRTSGGSEVSV